MLFCIKLMIIMMTTMLIMIATMLMMTTMMTMMTTMTINMMLIGNISVTLWTIKYYANQMCHMDLFLLRKSKRHHNDIYMTNYM